jgi:hypothetical protein
LGVAAGLAVTAGAGFGGVDGGGAGLAAGGAAGTADLAGGGTAAGLFLAAGGGPNVIRGRRGKAEMRGFETGRSCGSTAGAIFS